MGWPYQQCQSTEGRKKLTGIELEVGSGSGNGRSYCAIEVRVNKAKLMNTRIIGFGERFEKASSLASGLTSQTLRLDHFFWASWFLFFLVFFITLFVCYGRPMEYGRPLYFHAVICSSSFLFSSPNLSCRRLDVYHTSTHGVALVRI